MPSANLMPLITLGNWLLPFSLRQVRGAAVISLKTMITAVPLDRHPLVRTVAVTDRRKDALDGICGLQMNPMLGGKVVKGEQRLAILISGQALDGLRILLRVVGSKAVEGGGRLATARSHPDLVDIRFRRRLEHLRQLVQQHCQSSASNCRVCIDVWL
jgi:hypothetical protein